MGAQGDLVAPRAPKLEPKYVQIDAKKSLKKQNTFLSDNAKTRRQKGFKWSKKHSKIDDFQKKHRSISSKAQNPSKTAHEIHTLYTAL